MSEKKRLLLVGDDPGRQTGFSRQLYSICRHFVKKGWDVHFFGYYQTNTEGALVDDGGGVYPVAVMEGEKIVGIYKLHGEYPQTGYGSRKLIPLVMGLRPDYTVVLSDFFINEFMFKVKEDIRKLTKFVWMAVIDSDIASLPLMNFAKWVGNEGLVAYSKHGKMALETAGLKPAHLTHCIDCNVFRPLGEVERLKLRQTTQLQSITGEVQQLDKFGILVGSVFQNCFRKNPSALIESFPHFPKNAALLLHTNVVPQNQDGINLVHVFNTLPKDVANRIFITKQMGNDVPYTNDYMMKFYNLLDLFVSSTMGEGYNIPAIEALACGTPVALPDHTSGKEFVDGNPMSYRGITIMTSTTLRIWSGQQWGVTDPLEIALTAKEFLKSEFLTHEMRLKRAEWAKENYHEPTVMKKWEEYFDSKEPKVQELKV